MKATIESTNFVMVGDIVPILKAINASNTKAELVQNMHDCQKHISKYVHYGFGGNHLWVSDSQTNERLIITYF